MDPPCATIEVALASDRSLVAETVRAALAGRALSAEIRSWPGGRYRPLRDRAVGAEVDVLLVLSEARRLGQLDAVRQVLTTPARHRVALTSAPRGAIWGALLAAGADVVASASMTLDDLEKLLRDVVDETHVRSEVAYRDLVELWRQEELDQQAAAERLSTLTVRESQVLQLLHAGQPVRSIADSFAVTEATVRSQVKSLLRKLEVNSQLAAVAVLHTLA